MTSASSAGASVITLQFNLALNLDVAEQNVQEAINAANSLLPTGLPAPPIYAKVNPADQPILTLAVTSNSMSLTQLQDVANNRLASKISEVPGVGLVTPSGGNVPAVRVEADPHKLAAYGLNIDDLRTLLANINVSQPKGNFDGPDLDYTINDNDQIQDPKDYLNYGDCLPERRAGVHARRRQGHPGRAGHRTGRLVRPCAGDRAQCDAPARRERDRHGRPDQEAAAPAAGDPACRPCTCRSSPTAPA